MPRKKKSQSEPYLIIPRRTIRSKELNSLSVQSRWIYVVLCTEWNRIEDSDFMFPYKQIQDITGFEPHRISACLTELIKAGFIEKENHGGLLRNPNTYIMNSATWLYLKDKHGIKN